MAGNLPVPQTVEIKMFFGRSAVTEALNVIHATYLATDPTSQTLCNQIDAALKGQFTSSGLAAVIAPVVEFQGTTLRNMADPTDVAFTASGTPAVPGTATNPTPLPANVSICVTGSTGLRGRSYRSRTYLWGFSVAAVAASGGISTPTSVACAAFMNGVRTALGSLASPLTIGVLSRFTTPAGAAGAIERPTPIMTPITSFALRDLVFDSQRRRAIPGI